MYAVVIVKFTDAMKAKMEAYPTFANLKTSGDVIGLLNLIINVAYDYEASRYQFFH